MDYCTQPVASDRLNDTKEAATSLLADVVDVLCTLFEFRAFAMESGSTLLRCTKTHRIASLWDNGGEFGCSWVNLGHTASFVPFRVAAQFAERVTADVIAQRISTNLRAA